MEVPNPNSAQQNMEYFLKEYSDQKKEYKRVLKLALAERDPDRMKAYSHNLVDMNRQMSITVSSMTQLVSKTESLYDISALRKQLLEELKSIQNDIKTIRKSEGEKKVLQSLYDQTVFLNTRSDWTIAAYMIALLIGIVLVVVLLFRSALLSPAMPPLSMPSVSSFEPRPPQ
jgi:predicted amino acid-binding ACT domain protein